jgi:hypothetical protein
MLLHHKAKNFDKIIAKAMGIQVINAHIKIKIQNISMTTISINS